MNQALIKQMGVTEGMSLRLRPGSRSTNLLTKLLTSPDTEPDCHDLPKPKVRTLIRETIRETRTLTSNNEIHLPSYGPLTQLSFPRRRSSLRRTSRCASTPRFRGSKGRPSSARRSS